MPRLVITADLHGNHTAWLAIKALLAPGDALAVAGDLFDTRYGNYTNPVFDPEGIKEDLTSFQHPFYYVYGNCDTASFLSGYAHDITFSFSDRQIFMTHGHREIPCVHPADIVIQGHTHLAALEQKSNTVYMNPGSIAAPRNGRYTYGLIENNRVSLVEFNTGNELASLEL